MSLKADKFDKVFSSNSVDMSKMCPSFIKKHTLLGGVMGKEGAVERFEFKDELFMEIKTIKVNVLKMKYVYEIMKTNLECYKGLEKVTEIVKIKPITFCGCPFIQAIIDIDA
jgi:hypothetical protein